jgi:hypothetical protein
MDRNTGWLAALALGGWLLAPGWAGAGPLLDWWHGNDCPPGSYSCFHILTPNLLYAYERCHHPASYSYPVDRHPDVPLGYYITRYPCPQVPPAISGLDHYPLFPGPGATDQAASAARAEPSAQGASAPDKSRPADSTESR